MLVMVPATRRLHSHASRIRTSALTLRGGLPADIGRLCPARAWPTTRISWPSEVEALNALHFSIPEVLSFLTSRSQFAVGAVERRLGSQAS